MPADESAGGLDRNEGLSASAAEGGRWGLIRGVVLQVVTVISTMILARLLTPSAFGLVAAATVIVGVFDLLTRFGFGTSLVRRVDLNQREVSTIFWLALGVGVTAGLLASALATPMAVLMGQPAVNGMVIALAALVPVNLAGNIPSSLLLRQLRFRTVALVDVLRVGVYIIVAIWLAVLGLGAWAVILGHVAKSFVGNTCLFVLARWRPSLVLDSSYIREEFRFSGGILGGFWLHYLNGNLDYWVVSNALGAEALGVYYVAYVVPNLVRSRFTSVAQEVLYPVLARIESDIERVREGYLKMLAFLSSLAIPTMVGLALLADLVVELAFGAQWERASAPLAIFAVAAAINVISIPAGALTTALGKPHLMIPAMAFGLVILGAGLFFVIPSGRLDFVAGAVLISVGATAVARIWISSRLIGGSLGMYLRMLFPVSLSTGVMAVVVGLVKGPVVRSFPAVIASIVLVAAGLAVFLVFARLVFSAEFRRQSRYARLVLMPGKRREGHGRHTA